MSEERAPIVIDGEALYDQYKKVEDARYVYFGLRPRSEGIIGAEPCQIPDCPNLATRTLSVAPVALPDIKSLEIVMCDEHADGFYSEEA